MVVVFWVSLLLLIFTFAGYPLVLILLSYLIPQAKAPSNKLTEDDKLPTVEVILVVRNVSAIINKKIDSLLAIEYPKDRFRIMIVSDQSEDDTVTKISSHQDTRIQCIENTTKSSKSACLNQAIALSHAEILLMTDARQMHEPSSLKNLVSHFSDLSIGAVSGELVLLDPDTNEFSKGMDAYWRYEKFIRAQESIIASVPGVTGAIYAMRRAYFEPIPDETLLDDVLIPMNMILKGKRVLFESGAVAFDIPSDDPEREKIRKTRTLAGNWQLLELEPRLLSPFSNRIWFQFISHKILRLLAPLFLVLVLVSSIALSESTFYWAVMTLQISGYIILVAARFFPLITRLPLVKITQSFMTLMWFTVLGFWSFVTRSHLAIWK